MTKQSSCTICPLTKQSKLDFVSHNNLATLPFDLIHCDIWGPHHIPFYSRHQYFLTLVDDCTRFTWVYMLKHKSDVHIIIPNFFSLVTTQFGANIKQFRLDNAKELAFIDFFQRKMSDPSILLCRETTTKFCC